MTNLPNLPTGLLRRYMPMEQKDLAIVEEPRTVLLSISSAMPIEQWYATEILEHRDGSVDLSRAKAGGQVLFNHNADDYVGVIDDCWLDPVAQRCYASVRFDTHPRAEQIFASVQSGILRNVSIGYRVKEWQVEETANKSQNPIVRATSWELLEVSFVSVPADPSVGIDRSLSMEDPTEPEGETEEAPQEAGAEPAVLEKSTITEHKPVDHEIPTELLEAERSRTAALIALGDKHNLKKDLVQQWIATGVDLQSARSQVLDLIQSQAAQKDEVKPLNPLGLNQREKESYSIARALHNRLQLLEGKNPAQGLELEVHKAIEDKLGRPTEGIYVPVRDLNWGLNTRGYYSQRDSLQTGQATLGGNIVDTELRSSEFIEALRNRAMISRLGARMLSGLQGNIDIPRQSGTATTYWIAEGGTITESNLTIDLVSLRPKDLTCLTSVTRRMLMQGSLDVEALIRFDMLQQMALGIDLAAIAGTGINNQPLGILNTPGVGSVVIGASGGAPTWNHLVQLETEIAVDNADDGTCYYLTNARTRGKLKTTPKVTGQDVFLWTDSPVEKGMGMVNGYGAAVSNQVPSNGTKGSGTNLSSIIFGDFSQLLIGEWGVLEIMPNPYGQGYPSGSVQIRSMVTVDVVPRRPQYFAVCTDVVTT